MLDIGRLVTSAIASVKGVSVECDLILNYDQGAEERRLTANALPSDNYFRDDGGEVDYERQTYGIRLSKDEVTAFLTVDGCLVDKRKLTVEYKGEVRSVDTIQINSTPVIFITLRDYRPQN